MYINFITQDRDNYILLLHRDKRKKKKREIKAKKKTLRAALIFIFITQKKPFPYAVYNEIQADIVEKVN